MTYPSAARYPKVIIQSNPSNTGSVFIGGPAMNKATFANVGCVLAPGQSVALGRAGGSISLDELGFDGATTGKCFAHQYGVITMRYSKSYVWIVAVMLQSDNEDELLQGEVLGVYASLPAAQDAARSLAHRGRVGVIEFEVRS